MICSLLLLVHLLEGILRRNTLAYTLTLMQLFHHIILKVRAMVSDKLFQNFKPSNNLVEYEVGGYFTVGFNCRHNLIPFGDVINSHYNMMVPPSRSWVAIHKIEPPLSEGTGGDNGM